MAAVKPLVMTATGQWQRIQTGDFVPVSAGGTGATDAAGARTALGIDIDTDVNLTANSDTKIPSQKAVKAYVAANAGGGGGTGATRVTYANRANLRAGTPTDGAQAIVEELGYFVFTSGSTELDDDQTCFATSNGRWLMQAIGWGMMESYVLTIREDIDADIATMPQVVYSTLYAPGSPFVGVSSVYTLTVNVTGLLTTDHVIVTTNGSLAPLTSISWSATAGQVQIYLANGDTINGWNAPSAYRILVLRVTS